MTASAPQILARILEDGRLFPTLEIGGGWAISAQADHHGYGCQPRVRLPRLFDYDSAEVLIIGPLQVVDPHNLDLPEDLSRHFPRLADASPAIAHDFPVSQLLALREAIRETVMRNPNAGIPRGATSWPGARVFHGTGADTAAQIHDGGISMAASGGGYFGRAFYVADEVDLARSNYADFSDDEDGGAVLTFAIAEGARILDQRNAADAQAWTASGLSTADPDLPAKATALGIDGIYDRAVGGIAIYNPAVLDLMNLELQNEGQSPGGP